MLLKIGSKGEDVVTLQKKLGITADGDFGKKTQAKVIEFQKANNLTADGIVGDKTWAVLMKEDKSEITVSNDDIDITKAYLNVHISKCSTRTPQYLVIHFTAGGSSKAGRAIGCKSTFEKRKASADFAVDDGTIVQFNPDIPHYYCWAVGDGNGKYGITNKNSISIEICSNLTKGTSASAANHSGWYYTEESLANAIKLSKYLMKKYNIDKAHVVRHYDASRKLCPGIVGWNTGTLYTTDGKATKEKNTEEKWLEFKSKL